MVESKISNKATKNGPSETEGARWKWRRSEEEKMDEIINNRKREDGEKEEEEEEVPRGSRGS